MGTRPKDGAEPGRPSVVPGADSAARGFGAVGRNAEPPDRGSIEDVTGEAFLREATRFSQKRAGLVRMFLSTLMLVAAVLAAEGVEAPEVVRQVEAAKLLLLALGMSGAVIYLLAERGIGLEITPYVTVTVDAGLILGNLAYIHWALDAPANVTFLFPIIGVVPLALAANSVYYRPGLQALATALYVLGIGAIMLAAGNVPLADRARELERFDLLLGRAPNSVRLVMLSAAGIVLILAARQGRLLLDRAVRESTMRANLTRYLPAELAPMLRGAALEDLRRGLRIKVALLFVDIRGSTALAAGMEPVQLARFITAFRREVGRAAARNGGVIDKFIGDGALILFGVPNPDPTDAARALACARTLVRLIADWETSPKIEIGIGVHYGEVFCGVVGEESRLEFTVLGDPVNVAARLEQATKIYGEAVLASADVIQAASEPLDDWTEVSREPLRGVSRSFPIYTLREVSPSSARSTHPVLRPSPA